jgi:hypothetical protein
MGLASALGALASGGSMRVQVFGGFRRPDLGHRPGWDGGNHDLQGCDSPDCAFPGHRAAARSAMTVSESGLGPSRGGYVADTTDEALADTSGSGNVGSYWPQLPLRQFLTPWISAGATIRAVRLGDVRRPQHRNDLEKHGHNSTEDVPSPSCLRSKPELELDHGGENT